MESEEIPATHLKETTLTTSAAKPVPTGRPCQSPVRNYFSFDAAKEQKCLWSWNTSWWQDYKVLRHWNQWQIFYKFKAHLKTAHPQAFAEVSTVCLCVRACVLCVLCCVCCAVCVVLCVLCCVCCAVCVVLCALCCVRCVVCVRICMSTLTSLSDVLSWSSLYGC